MKLDTNDPRITAYILDELDAEDRATFEKEIEGCEESQAHIEEMRTTADLLSAELGRETVPALARGQREKIEASLDGKTKSHGFGRWLFDWRVGVLVPTMACMLLIVLNTPYMKDRTDDTKHIVGIPSREWAPQGTRDGVPETLTESLQVPSSPVETQALEQVGQRRPSLDQKLSEPASQAPANEAEVLENRSDPSIETLDRYATAQDAPVSGFSVRPEELMSQMSTVEADSDVEFLQQQAVDKSGLAMGTNAVTVTGSRPIGQEGTVFTDSMGRSQMGGMPGLTAGVAGSSPKSELSRDNLAFYYESTSGTNAPIDGPISRATLGEVRYEVGFGLNPSAPGVPPGDRFYGFEESRENLSKYPGTEDYQEVIDNAFKNPLEEGYSTFSIDVDTAAYANMRRFLNGGSLPPKDAVRIEEMVNYFNYDYPGPDGEVPFSANIETATCPWNAENKLVRIGLKGKEIEAEDRGPANLVFLIDVSGSMEPENKLPLLKQGLKLLVQQLQPMDRVAIVTYAGSSGLALPSTSLEQREAILGALDTFQAGGSTNGGSGIQLAYKTAREHFEEEGINRVVLATDGDFNVGVTDRNDLIGLIEREAKSGIFLSVLGFGMGNLKDGNLESLADKGNGNYAYIDNLKEAQKVLVQQAGSTLVTIAKDVKIQVEFNPAKVGAYRLIGYENRVMPAEHFNDDTKDAGEIGAGHRVTALYEIVPKGKPVNVEGVDPMRYQASAFSEPKVETVLAAEAESDELLNLKLRYKPPKEDTSKLIEFPIEDTDKPFSEASTDMRFAASVASFGMILRDSPYKGNSNFDSVLEIAKESRGKDEHGYRSEFVQLVELAKALAD